MMSKTLTRRAAKNRAGVPSIFSIDPFTALRGEFDQLLSNWFADNGESLPVTFSPSIDLTETDTNYDVKVDLPGLQANEIKVQLSDNVLTISGERKYEKSDGNEKDKNGGKNHFVERYYGTFSRSILLPGTVKSDKIDAKYSDGVLAVTLPKAEECKACEIPVKT